MAISYSSAIQDQIAYALANVPYSSLKTHEKDAIDNTWSSGTPGGYAGHALTKLQRFANFGSSRQPLGDVGGVVTQLQQLHVERQQSAMWLNAPDKVNRLAVTVAQVNRRLRPVGPPSQATLVRPVGPAPSLAHSNTPRCVSITRNVRSADAIALSRSALARKVWSSQR